MKKLQLGHVYDFRPISSFKGKSIDRRIYEGGVIAAEVLAKIVRDGHLDLVAQVHVFEVLEDDELQKSIPFVEGLKFDEFQKDCSFKYEFFPAFFPFPTGGSYPGANFFGALSSKNPAVLAFRQGLGDPPPVFQGPNFFTTIDKYAVDGHIEISKRFCISFVNNRFFFNRSTRPADAQVPPL